MWNKDYRHANPVSDTDPDMGDAGGDGEKKDDSQAA